MQPRAFVHATVFLALIATLAGCGGPKPADVLLGRWRIRPESVALQSRKITQNPDGSRISNKEAFEAGKSYGSFSIDFRADHTYTMNEGVQTEGT